MKQVSNSEQLHPGPPSARLPNITPQFWGAQGALSRFGSERISAMRLLVFSASLVLCLLGLTSLALAQDRALQLTFPAANPEQGDDAAKQLVLEMCKPSGQSGYISVRVERGVIVYIACTNKNSRANRSIAEWSVISHNEIYLEGLFKTLSSHFCNISTYNSYISSQSPIGVASCVIR